MVEQKISVTENGQYKNINLKDIDPGNYIVVTKGQFAEGKKIECHGAGGKTWDAWLCGVECEGVDVAFFLNKEEQADEYAATGGVGDVIQIHSAVEKYTYTDKKGKEQSGYAPVFTFKLNE